jgi:Sel1 repeat-containing protein
LQAIDDITRVFARIDRAVTTAPIHAALGKPAWDRRRRRGAIDPSENGGAEPPKPRVDGSKWRALMENEIVPQGGRVVKQRSMPFLAGALVLALALLGTAAAGPLEDGAAAYQRGDYATAMRFWRPLSDLGNATAQNNLGVMYYHGRGVLQDFTQAVAWYRKAADLGNAAAQNSLGVMYANGQGVPKDDAQAVAWYRKAADQGYAFAQSNLGSMYERGQGVPKNGAQAVAWYRKATGDKGADLLSAPSSSFATSLTVPTEDGAQQSAHCQNIWTKRGIIDLAMYSYCMKYQHDGYEKLVDLAHKYESASWIQKIVDVTLDKWTKKGVRDDEMVAYELGKQLDAFEDLAYLAKQKEFDPAKYVRCTNHWGFQFEMVVYCYKEEE